VRYGYRKIRVLLNREGWKVGKNLVYCLYEEEALTLRHKPRRKRRAALHRHDRFRPTAPNQVWNLDFVSGWTTVPCGAPRIAAIAALIILLSTTCLFWRPWSQGRESVDLKLEASESLRIPKPCRRPNSKVCREVSQDE